MLRFGSVGFLDLRWTFQALIEENMPKSMHDKNYLASKNSALITYYAMRSRTKHSISSRFIIIIRFEEKFNFCYHLYGITYWIHETGKNPHEYAVFSSLEWNSSDYKKFFACQPIYRSIEIDGGNTNFLRYKFNRRAQQRKRQKSTEF